MSTNEPVNIVIGDWRSLRADATPVRHAVFVLEQKVPVELELDELDACAMHAVAYADGEPVGTARLLPDGQIGRMAVMPGRRGCGVGSQLLEAMLKLARDRGDRSALLHAQLQAIPFYRKHGFTAEGDVFLDAGIEHVSMRHVFS